MIKKEAFLSRPDKLVPVDWQCLPSFVVIVATTDVKIRMRLRKDGANYYYYYF